MKVHFILLFFIIISCNKKLNQNKSLEVYFFDVDHMTTTLPISCGNMTEFDYLTKINIEDIVIYNSVLDDIKKSKNDENISENDIDVRYKIILNEDEMCIDYYGEFILNGKYRGKLTNFVEIKEYIHNNKNDYIEITERIPAPENL